MNSVLLVSNPAKRHAKKKRTSVKRRALAVAHNPIRRRRPRRFAGLARSLRRYRRNPISHGNLGDRVTSMAMDGAIGAAGGLLVDAALKPMPLDMKMGPVSHLVRAGISIGLGLIGAMAKIPVAAKLATGGLTITLYNAGREYITTPMGLNEYTHNDMAGLGLPNPEDYEQASDGSMNEYTTPSLSDSSYDYAYAED